MSGDGGGESTPARVAELKRALENEKAAPEILRYQQEIVLHLKSQVAPHSTTTNTFFSRL